MKRKTIFKKDYFCKTLLLFVFFIISIANVFSQDEASYIQQSFEKYISNSYTEKVFLHTDKSVYATGEVLWFKAYVTDAASNNSSFLSKICYVEILSNENKAVLQAKIDVDSGHGTGSFLIPSSLGTGNYLLRSYTNWMKNFDPQYYFTQTITIINPNKKPQPNTDTVPSYHVQFFPEGGNIVYGLKNNVAFKITDAFGRGIDAKGTIVNEKNDTAVIFTTEKFGMGTFLLSPLLHDKYDAIISVKGKTIRIALPQIFDKGWVMHLRDSGNVLNVSAVCNIEDESAVFLFTQSGGSIKFAKLLPLHNGVANFTMNKSELSEGISHLTLFNQNRQPVCERLYFKKPTNILLPKFQGLQNEYDPRTLVNSNITINDSIVNVDMSVAVYLVDSLQPAVENNIINYLWLTSELKGNIESPEYYFENSTAETARATDILMLTQGWRRFKWEDVLKNTKPSFTFLPEHEGHIISGNFLQKNIQDNVKENFANLSVPGVIFRFSNASISESNNLRFNVRKFYGSHELIIQPDSTDKEQRIFINSPFSDAGLDNVVHPIELIPNLTNKILLRTIAAQATNIYQPEADNNFIMPSGYDSIPFFGVPSKTYMLDEYTRFSTMEEVMREYVKEVSLKKRDNNFHFEVFNESEVNLFHQDPLVLVDGVRVFDINNVIAIDPLKIRKIDVVTRKFLLGQHEYDGIVSYSTYNGDLQGFQINPNALVVEYDGLQFEREFYSPQFTDQQQASSRIPDYRNVLYWAPHFQIVNGKQNLSFYTSDIPGKYLIVIQGISSSGIAGFGTATFKVGQ